MHANFATQLLVPLTHGNMACVALHPQAGAEGGDAADAQQGSN